MCHILGRGGQCISKEPIPMNGKAKEASLGHVNGPLLKEVTL